MKHVFIDLDAFSDINQKQYGIKLDPEKVTVLNALDNAKHSIHIIGSAINTLRADYVGARAIGQAYKLVGGKLSPAGGFLPIKHWTWPTPTHPNNPANSSWFYDSDIGESVFKWYGKYKRPPKYVLIVPRGTKLSVIDPRRVVYVDSQGLQDQHLVEIKAALDIK